MKAFLVTDSPFNQEWNADFIGMIFDKAPSYTTVEEVEVTEGMMVNNLSDVLRDRASYNRRYAFSGPMKEDLPEGGFKMALKNGWTVSLISRPNTGLLECAAWRDKEERKPILCTTDEVIVWLNTMKNLPN